MCEMLRVVIGRWDVYVLAVTIIVINTAQCSQPNVGTGKCRTISDTFVLSLLPVLQNSCLSSCPAQLSLSPANRKPGLQEFSASDIKGPRLPMSVNR